MNIPPPQCPPPLTDWTASPSIRIHEFSYPYQRQLCEAPIGSITYSFNTCGSGRRQILSAASARTLTLTSLYSYAVPGSFLLRVNHSDGLLLGRSAHSGFPHKVPSQSLVCLSMCSQVIFRLCSVSNGSSSSDSPNCS